MKDQDHTTYDPPRLTYEGQYDIQTMSIGPIIIVRPGLPDPFDFGDKE